MNRIVWLVIFGAFAFVGHHHLQTGRMPWEPATHDGLQAELTEMGTQIQEARSAGETDLAKQAGEAWRNARAHLRENDIKQADRALRPARRLMSRFEGQSTATASTATSSTSQPVGPRPGRPVGGGTPLTEQLTVIDMQRTVHSSSPAGPNIRGGRTKAREAAAAAER